MLDQEWVQRIEAEARELAAARERICARRSQLVADIAARLRAEMDRRGLDMPTLGRRTGINAKQLARLRDPCGTVSGPDAAELEALSAALGCTPRWLAWGLL